MNLVAGFFARVARAAAAYAGDETLMQAAVSAAANVIVADGDGAVLIPAALIDAVLELAPEQERFEGWIWDEVGKGAALPGLYPPSAENKARYEASKGKSHA